MAQAFSSRNHWGESLRRAPVFGHHLASLAAQALYIIAASNQSPRSNSQTNSPSRANPLPGMPMFGAGCSNSMRREWDAEMLFARSVLKLPHGS